jgi:hypothetical protein
MGSLVLALTWTPAIAAEVRADLTLQLRCYCPTIDCLLLYASQTDHKHNLTPTRHSASTNSFIQNRPESYYCRKLHHDSVKPSISSIRLFVKAAKIAHKLWTWFRPPLFLHSRTANLQDLRHPLSSKPSNNGYSQKKSSCRRRRLLTACPLRRSAHYGAKVLASSCK